MVIYNKAMASKTLRKLPNTYTEIHPTILKKEDLYAPKKTDTFLPDSRDPGFLLQSQFQWLNHAYDICQGNQLEENLSWSAYYASLHVGHVKVKALTALLPLFYENAHPYQ